MNCPLIPPSSYVYETAELVVHFAAAHASFVAEKAKYEPGTAGHSMNDAFAAATHRESEMARRLLAAGIDLISLKEPLASPNLGLVPPVVTPTTKSLTEQVAAMPKMFALI